MRIRVLQNIIDILRLKKKPFFYYKRHYRKLLDKEKSLKNKDVIQVAFLYKYSSDCQAFNLLDRLLLDKEFEVSIIINPDISRGEEHFAFQYHKTKEYFVKHYGQEIVLDGYDFGNSAFVDFTKDKNFDLMLTDSPYETMAHDFFKIQYWIEKGILVLYISYFYMGRCRITIDNLAMEHMSKVWLFCVENPFVLSLAKKYMPLRGRNIIMSGYPKMDSLQSYTTKADRDQSPEIRKRVIVAPHHSFYFDFIGAFMCFYDVLLQCMKDFSEIDFVFRPHPLLIINLKKDEWWGEAKTDEYLESICALPNVKYSEGGDYMEEFVKCDALIHDCGSFMAEFLYTDKPCAFMYREDLDKAKQFTAFGIKCLEAHYSIFNRDDMYSFLRNVVLGGNDIKREERISFARNEVMINYPYATEFIYQQLRERLRNESKS